MSNWSQYYRFYERDFTAERIVDFVNKRCWLRDNDSEKFRIANIADVPYITIFTLNAWRSWQHEVLSEEQVFEYLL